MKTSSLNLAALLAGITAGGLVSAGEPPAGAPASRTPVLVELFTSEGCSSCPAADKLLAELEKTQPVAEAVVIPLSLHVDYWNRLGWVDPFSSAAFTTRQGDYAERLSGGRVYTPQMVVDGGAELIGGDPSKALRAITAAARGKKLAVSVVPGAALPSSVPVRVSVPAPPAGQPSADVILVLTEDRLESDVARGENAGRKLAHLGVVRTLDRIGKIKAGAAFDAERTIPIEKGWNVASMHAVAFLQERSSGKVIGVARAALARP